MTALEPPSTNGRAPAPVSTHELLRLRVLDRLRRDGADDLDPAAGARRDPDTVMATIRDVVDRYQRDADKGIGARLTNPAENIARLGRSFLEAAVLTKYFVNPERADEVEVHAGVVTATHRDGRQTVDPEPTCAAEMTATITRLLAEAEVSVDLEHTIGVHQIWDNQVRASVSIPPTAEDLDCTFRIYRELHDGFPDLIQWDSLPPTAANFLVALCLARTRRVFSGEPGSGKTTLLAASLAATPPTTNVRIIQRYRELSAPHLRGGHWLAGPGGQSMRDLIAWSKNWNTALLVPGETLGAEAVELIPAAASGCGFASTIHSFSATEAMNSLATAASMATDTESAADMRRTFARLIDVVVHCEATPLHLVAERGGRLRQVMEICTVPAQLSHDEFVLEPLFRREALGEPMEYCGHQGFGEELETRLNRCLPGTMTVRDLCEGTATLL